MVLRANGIFSMRGPHGVAAYTQKRQEIREMEKSNATLARENQLKREYIERLRQSQAEQELEIRQRLSERSYDAGQRVIEGALTFQDSPPSRAGRLLW